MASPDQIVAALNKKISGADFTATPLLMRGDEPGDQMFIRVEPAQLIDVLTFLRDDAAMKFEQLVDLTCVDYLNFPDATDRYGVIYSLLSHTHGHRIFLKAFVNDPEPKLASATPIWKGADWMEREVFDMFGITFEGHPDLRRILTWDDFGSFPLRKDYPLRGKGERTNYEVTTRDSA